MYTTVATPPDLASEIPQDSAPTPDWFEQALSVPRQEGWVESGGCEIHYFSWGDTSNPGILMLHGFLAHSRCFAFIAPFLAKDHFVVAYDFSGMGDSGVRDAYPDHVRLQELMDVANATGILDNEQKPTIIAHSYGGSVGLLAMEQEYAQFNELVICDLMTLRPERLVAHRKERGQPPTDEGKRPNSVYPDYETAKSRFVLSPQQEVNEAYLFDYMAFHSLKAVPDGWSWKFDPGVFETTVDLHGRLQKQAKRIVEAPGRITIVYGEQSKLFDADSADYLVEIGGEHISMIGIPNAAHHLMLDQPMAFVSVLKTVLKMTR